MGIPALNEWSTMLMPYRLPLMEIDTQQGKLMIRPYMMTGTISKYYDPSLYEPHEFAVLFLHDIIHYPEFTIEEISKWDDASIEQVLDIWLKEQTEEVWKQSDDVSLFEGFQRSYREYVLQHTRRMQEIITNAYAPMFTSMEKVLQQQSAFYGEMAQITASFSASLEPLRKSLNKSINLMANSVLGDIQSNIAKMFEASTFSVPTIDLGGLFKNLPDIRKLTAPFDRLEVASDALDSDGYYLLDYWSLSNIAQFIGVDQVDLRVRSAVVTNKLLGITRHQDFLDEAKLRFSESSVLGRRWRVIEQALVAHRNRHYAISIPTLLAQIEGIFTDALVLKGEIKQYNGKFYARDQFEAFKVGKGKKPSPLHGLWQKVKKSDLQDKPLLHDISRFFIDYLISERNDILHGRIVNYDKAKLSVHLLLYISLLAAEFAEFESGK